MPLAMAAGLLIAVGRLYGPRWLNWLLGAYVELLRGTPLLLQLSVIYYLLPTIGIALPAFWAGVLGLAINYSAYEAENYRAGLLAIPRGQMEAALSLGMTTATALRRVIVPQAVRIVIPPVTNDFIALFKDTSVCSVIAVTELTSRYRYLAVNYQSYIIQLGLMTAILYLLMSYPLSLIARRLEKRFPRVVV
jgi:polar amino acid transport system substrate-binding protein